MEVILHIGMGKTGTSSIQTALANSGGQLAERGYSYLGMWFDLIEPRFHGIAGQGAFFQSAPEEMKDHARKFLAALREKAAQSGVNRFILSNEDIYAGVCQIAPFVSELRQHAAVRLIAYVRDPYEWLPSAYSQWAIFHKLHPGRIQSYQEFSRHIVKVYSGFQLWEADFHDILTVRPFMKSGNVVEDFSAVLGLPLEVPEQRMLEQIDVAEGVLRAIYNDRLRDGVVPEVFQNAFRGVNFSKTPRVEEILDRSFSYQDTGQVILENKHLFEFINEKFSIDFTRQVHTPPAPPDAAAARERLLEHVLQIVVQQADRITELERAVTRLQNEQVKP
ncbi:polysaccharide biosynthesis protein [Antarcticimicrobium luteum]|uniref:Polysaccharide biosynthesis protein n=1 Tax=Antarcticimicrobium luteum TaxID=2547397 RepID=A0A4R5VF60_9RHOB|nr:polysaccharide biosynthesis protein [Antarcticimicrobium luteum]TDK50901.1 polysaccharide biosynthesis protein [Antarcticimicrobium luteum]